MAKDLKAVQGEMTQKELVFHKVEQELRYKLAHLSDTQGEERNELLRRIDDLQGEIQHLQSAKQEKEERLKAQVQRSEKLLGELERLSAELTHVKEEKEATIETKGARERELEHSERSLKRVRDRMDSLAKSVRNLERSIFEICERQII